MENKPTKIHPIGAAKPLTKEEMQANQARFFLQKRESFAQGVLYNLCNSCGASAIAEPEVIVKKSVEIADLLMKALFVDPLPELKPSEESK